MKQIFGSLLASCVVLSGCGGKLQSPDFQSVLKGIDVVFTPVSGSNTATTAPGSTFRFNAVGLYSTPPGTKADAQTVACGTANEPAALCTLGEITGVTWSVDPAAGTTGVVASIDATGLATGVRRGIASVRARAQGLEATEALVVDGAVLTGFTIAPTPGTTVPTGRSITLTATPSCSNRSGPTACTRTDYAYAWELPVTLAPDTVTFTPTPARGRLISVRTNRFGPFSIDSSVTNEEGTVVTQSINLSASAAVLESISIIPTSGGLPVVIPNGNPSDFLLRGVLSNGQVVSPVTSGELAAGTMVIWSKEDNSNNTRGDITLESQAGKVSPNSTLRVTGARLGPTNLMARATNILNEPVLLASTSVAGSNGINVIDATITALTQICPASAVGDLCPQNVQIPLTSSVKFKARGMFSDGIVRDIGADRIDWIKTAGVGDVTVDTETAATLVTGQGYTGTRRGAATITGTLKTAFQTGATPITQTAPVVVIDGVCADEFFMGNGSVTTATTTGTTAAAPSSVANVGNLIDNSPTTFANFRIAAGLTNSVLAASVNRPAQLMTASPTVPRSVGVLARFDADNFNPAQQMQIALLDAAGAVIGAPLPVTATSVMRGNEALTLVSAAAAAPFTGIRVLVQVPNVTAITPISGGMFDPSFLNTLQAILGGGGSIAVDADSACASLR